MRIRASTAALCGQVTGTLLAIADINVKLSRVVELLEGGIDGEEWPPEDDA